MQETFTIREEIVGLFKDHKVEASVLHLTFFLDFQGR